MSDQQPAGQTPQPRKNNRLTRRRRPRGTTKVRCYANALGLGRNVALGIRDLSETGVQLLTMQLPAKPQMEVILESPGGRTVKLLAEVIWSRALPEGKFLIGTRFAKGLSYADLASLAHE